jgi:hypothetical protein
MGNRLALMLLLFFPLCLFAQETEKSYFIDDSSGTIRFIQRLSWYPEDYTSRYEVRIESLSSNGSYREVLRRSTQAEYLEISLPPGLYRYRVQSYDLLEKPVGNPPWISLEVLPALKPELFSLEPDTISGRSASFTIRGRNLVENGQVILRNRESGREEKGSLRPAPDGTSAEVVFSSHPATGSYDVIVENPGGLSGSTGPLTVLSNRVFNLSVGYSPLYPFSGRVNEMLESSFYPLGFSARLNTVPFEWKGFGLGLEAAAGWAYLSSPYSSGGLDYDVTGHFADLRLHFLAQKWLADNRFALSLHVGGGLAAMLHFQKQISGLDTEAVNVLYPAGSAGLSLLWPFGEKYFALLGLEYLYLFSKDQSNPTFILPFIGLGMKL